MLPPAQRAALADESLLHRLADVPNALIVIRNDRAGKTMLAALAKLREAIRRDYETVASFGSYTVLRRKVSQP
jgi:delta 1-pyrroline-5-carboxylate dehydrogenase